LFGREESVMRFVKGAEWPLKTTSAKEKTKSGLG